jgi:hypothetical protein
MKSLSIASYLTAFVLLFTACKKEAATAEEPVAQTNTTLSGTWELAFSASGMSAPRDYPLGNGHLMTFNGTEVIMYRDGQQVYKDSYTVVPDNNAATATCNTLPPDQFRQALLYGNSPHRTYIQITGRTLTMMSGCFAADGGVSRYRKLTDAVLQ